ncbi:unnamed protein product [Caenorhabditis nigoni]
MLKEKPSSCSSEAGTSQEDERGGKRSARLLRVPGMQTSGWSHWQEGLIGVGGASAGTMISTPPGLNSSSTRGNSGA